MKIAYLVNQYPAVSHSFIRREILALERQGHEVQRISIRGNGADHLGQEDRSEAKRTRFVLDSGIKRLLLAFLRMLATRPAALVKALALVWKLGRRAERPLPVHFIYLLEACLIYRWIKDDKAEHLHAHFGTNSAEVAMLVHVLGGPPWSFTAHGPEEFDKAQFIALPEKIRRASFVVAISSFGRSQLFRQVSHDQWPKIRIVRCGLEPSFYEGKDGLPLGAAPRLVCVGRLCDQKGQLLLLEAATKLRDAGIEFELVLAGDGEMRNELERLIDTRELRPVVRITGWITSSQVREEILASRALILPSFAEGLPVVIMEAMALRRPVISTFVAGIPELVEPGEHGWLVSAGDVDGLAAAMRACLECPDEALSAMGKKAQEKVLRFHDIDQEAAHLAELFQSVRETSERGRSRQP
ncbi:glycosyltransferase family 4 protein [Bradyrhizobium sp. INPA01-394B]|uniref:Glycosyltransferase family 4 protein n=1 Tax=Bradyrhizobium campsiandrae TaxID=1729892 RepID=A0ABR7UG72_9BRAD|nr:glycosyltransferase family 4 protein [Bradyrhizobium campsiandrae]MBC9878325.1 glycosyltransferase family 4 protein [Bradyrhizobium campsiandrae]MBC9982407.1 glycosyltransferase family 4 protein [Bradyrhizobium campsiandrae]